MTPQEETFFKAFGHRLAALRRQRGLTQVQLAEMLGISQQHVVSIEKGRRRMPMSHLPALVEVLAVPIDELIVIEQPAARRGPRSKLQRQLEQLQRLPRAQQRVVSQMLDGVLQQQAAS